MAGGRQRDRRAHHGHPLPLPRGMPARQGDACGPLRAARFRLALSRDDAPRWRRHRRSGTAIAPPAQPSGSKPNAGPPSAGKATPWPMATPVPLTALMLT